MAARASISSIQHGDPRILGEPHRLIVDGAVCRTHADQAFVMPHRVQSVAYCAERGPCAVYQIKRVSPVHTCTRRALPFLAEISLQLLCDPTVRPRADEVNRSRTANEPDPERKTT